MQSAFDTHESWEFALTAAILFVLRWTVYLAMASVHFTRRALHIVSFGALYYPGSSGKTCVLSCAGFDPGSSGQGVPAPPLDRMRSTGPSGINPGPRKSRSR